jgi:hypothetical protein
MKQPYKLKSDDTGRPGLIAIGFIAAFAASVFTVIYTGLNVQSTSAEFDSGFRSVTMKVADVRTIDLVFESAADFSDGVLTVTLPEMVALVGEEFDQQHQKSVAVTAGGNTFQIDIRALESGRGYLRARVDANGPVGVYRVFVTVDDD